MDDLANPHAPNGPCSRDGCKRKGVIGGRCKQHYYQDYNREQAARLRLNRDNACRVREVEGGGDEQSTI